MAFFNSPKPDENEGSPENHSAKTRPLFKQDENLPGNLSGKHISLSAYISRHLVEGEPKSSPDTTKQSETPMPIPKSFGPAQKSAAGSQIGQGGQLNSLDVDLVAGLESYLPTPIFRMRVMKKRLDSEIQDLKQKLSKYERLPEQSTDMQSRIEGIRSRIQTLEEHEREVSRELEALLTFGPVFYGFVKGGQRVTQWLGNLAQGISEGIHSQITSLAYGPAYPAMANATGELRDLQEILAERMRDPAVSDTEISQLLVRYEQTLRQMETAALSLQAGPFPQRLWRRANRLLK